MDIEAALTGLVGRLEEGLNVNVEGLLALQDTVS